MKIQFNQFILAFFMAFGVWFVHCQEIYNHCDNALELCPNEVFSINNIDANSTVCPDCEDDFNFCFTGQNSIWLTFTTNDDGGDVLVDFSQIVFENLVGQGNALQAVIVEAVIPCIPSTFTEVSNCVSNATTDFQLIATNLPANTTYYIIVNGAFGTTSYAEATFDVQISGLAVDRNPTFFIGTESLTICRGNSTVFDIDLQGCDDPSPVVWYLNGEEVGRTEGFFVYEGTISDQDVVTAEISCFDSCRDTLQSNPLTLTVLDFLVDAGSDKTIFLGESIQLDGATTETDILWTPDYFISDTNSIRPIVSPNETTTYYLIVDNGICSIVDEVTVYIKDALEIPNTFSPNGDGINETWEILGIEAFPDCHIQIFTRWGQLVFETTGYNSEKRWTGTTKGGNELTEGTYYYVINLRDKAFEEPLKGTVSIIR